MKLLIQLIERGAVADCDVIDLVDGGRERRHGLPRFARNDGGGRGCGHGGGEQIGLDGVVDVAEIAAGFAVAVDEDGLALDHAGDPLRYDGCVGAIGVLARAKDVEVAQADGFEAIGAGEDVGVDLVDQLSDGVGRQRLADVVFDLGQRRMVAVGGAAGGVDEALYFGIARGNEHVEEAADVGFVGGDGVFD